MKNLHLFLILAVAASLAGCASTVKQPKGTSKGYTSARFVRAKAGSPPDFIDNSEQANRMIDAAIRSQFQANGIAFREEAADLVVGYLLIVQNNASTGMVDDHFGYGRDSTEIRDLAHKRGVIKGERPDYFEAGAIVIDLVDAKTNELVFRNYAKRDLIENVSAEVRRKRINAAVAEALGPFFR